MHVSGASGVFVLPKKQTSPAMSEGDFLIYTRMTKAGADALQLSVQRKGEQRDVTLSLKND